MDRCPLLVILNVYCAFASDFDLNWGPILKQEYKFLKNIISFCINVYFLWIIPDYLGCLLLLYTLFFL